MHGISKIDRSRTGWQLNNLALGSKYIDLIGKEVNFDVFDKFERVPRIALHFQQALHPLARTAVTSVDGLTAVGFVEEMRSDAAVSHFVHFLGADLHFNRHPMHSHQHRMQRLVTVGFGNGDVILELAGHWLIKVVHYTEHAVTGVYRIHHYAEGVDIHNFFEELFLLAHLFIDAEQ